MPLVLVLLALLAGGQRPTDIVKWSAMPPVGPVEAGDIAKIRLTARIENGWKLYALSQPKGGPVPLEIVVDKNVPLKIVQSEITGPKPKLQKDDNFNLETLYYEQEAAFSVPVRIPRTASGKLRVPLDVTFQTCGAEICLRPFTQRLTVELVVSR